MVGSGSEVVVETPKRDGKPRKVTEAEIQAEIEASIQGMLASKKWGKLERIRTQMVPSKILTY